MREEHAPRSSEEGTADSSESARRRERRAATPLPTRREHGPRVYRARIASEAMRLALNTPAGSTPNEPPPRDASEGTFGARDFLESVIGSDDRARVDNNNQNPWRWICALHIHCKDDAEFVGTGFLIGERTVITAGHCVYIAPHGGWAKSIDVIPALNGTAQPYGAINSSRLRAPDGWVSETDTNVDYGAIILGRPIGLRTGYFGVGALDDANILSTDANIAGYPADLDRATKLYFHSRKINEVTPRRLFYDIDTFGGDSGAGIFLNVDGSRIVIGIHTTGSSRTNSGTRITSDVLANLKTWRNEK